MTGEVPFEAGTAPALAFRMTQRLSRILALALLAPLAACAAPTESDDARDGDPSAPSSQAQPLIGFQAVGDQHASLVFVTRTGSTAIKTGTLIDSTTVLIASSAVPLTTAPSQVTLTFGSSTGPSATAIDIVRHPTLDVALVKLAAPFANGRAMGLDTRSTSSLVGKVVRCVGFNADRHVVFVNMNVTGQNGSELTMEPTFASQQALKQIENSDGGVPCFDGETNTVVGIANRTTGTNPMIHTQIAAAAFAGWLPGAQNLFGVRAQRLIRPFSLSYLRAPNDPNSRTCLDLTGGATSSGTAVNQWPCHYGQNQSFYFDFRTSSSHPALVSAASGLCIDIPGPTSNAIGLQQYACHGRANQGWEMFLPTPQGGGFGYRSQQYANRCITGVGAPTFGGGLRVLSDACPNNTASQQQRFFIRWN